MPVFSDCFRKIFDRGLGEVGATGVDGLFGMLQTLVEFRHFPAELSTFLSTSGFFDEFQISRKKVSGRPLTLRL